MSSDSDLEALRQRRLRELAQSQMQQAASQQMQRAVQEEQVAAQIKVIMNQVLEPAAKERLANIRTAKPDFARQIEILLIQLYQGGQLPARLTDESFKKILERIHEKKREPRITLA